MSVWERISLFVAACLVALPAVNLAAIAVVQRSDSRVTWFLVGMASILGYLFVRPNIKHVRIFPWPLYLALTVQIALIGQLTTAFLALPDVDPYHWVKAYQTDFLTGAWDTVLHRPLFFGLVHLLDTIGPFTPEEVFKYALPALSLLTLIPAWQVARQVPHRLQQILILLYPALSPTLIISAHLSTPQSVLNIITIYFVLFLIYAYLTRQQVWHYAAGALMFASILYHGLALFIFTLWLIGTLWVGRYRYLSILIILAVFCLSAPYLLKYAPAAGYDIGPNLSFPAAWQTIDAVPDGWPGLQGITQYYAFYAGPVVLALIALYVCQIASKKISWAALKEVCANPSALVLFLLLDTFFIIAEIAPRVLNIVVLPERAWLIIALVSPILVATLPRRLSTPRNLGIATLLLITSIGGAIYVNQQKTHSIPDYVVESARWIGQNIPREAKVASNRSPDYLDLYTGSPVHLLENSFYCDHKERSAESFHQALRNRIPESQYLYIAIEDQQHPYAARPWHEEIKETCVPAALATDSTYFKSVYHDDNRAGVWEIL